MNSRIFNKASLALCLLLGLMLLPCALHAQTNMHAELVIDWGNEVPFNVNAEVRIHFGIEFIDVPLIPNAEFTF